jgi:hypothetical protein
VTGDAKELFLAWLAERGGAVPHEDREIIEHVRYLIEVGGEARFDDLDIPAKQVSATGKEIERANHPVRDRLGYRKDTGAKRLWYIRPTVWKREFCAGRKLSDVSRVLISIGALQPGDGHGGTLIRLIDGKPERFYVLTPAILKHD